MERGIAGHYSVTTDSGEVVRAFVPASLPPEPPLAFTGDLQQLLESALLALGRLDSAVHFLPDTSVFLYHYVRKEAVLSSQIEGTRSTLSHLLLSEIEGAPGVIPDDVGEVSNYVAALTASAQRLPVVESPDSRDPRSADVRRARP